MQDSLLNVCFGCILQLPDNGEIDINYAIEWKVISTPLFDDGVHFRCRNVATHTVRDVSMEIATPVHFVTSSGSNHAIYRFAGATLEPFRTIMPEAFWPKSIELPQRAQTPTVSVDSHYPHKCPRCGGKAYVTDWTLDCVKGCK